MAVQPQNMVRGLIFHVQEEEGLYYLCSENKITDQLRGYPTADLRPAYAYAKIRFSTDMTHMSLVVRKPAFCICENKDADQLRVCEANQRLCFRYTDSTIPLLSKSKI